MRVLYVHLMACKILTSKSSLPSAFVQLNTNNGSGVKKIPNSRRANFDGSLGGAVFIDLYSAKAAVEGEVTTSYLPGTF